MTQFINSFYALEDIKKRTAKYFDKVSEAKVLAQGHQAPQESAKKVTSAEHNPPETASSANNCGQFLLEESFIFKHFYYNKRSLIRRHIKETKEE